MGEPKLAAGSCPVHGCQWQQLRNDMPAEAACVWNEKELKCDECVFNLARFFNISIAGTAQSPAQKAGNPAACSSGPLKSSCGRAPASHATSHHLQNPALLLSRARTHRMYFIGDGPFKSYMQRMH